MRKVLLAVLAMGAMLGSLTAQVGVGTTTPNASAVLDVSSSSKGLLVPRMTQAQRAAIASPATGLLVFQTDSVSVPSGFYYNAGTPAAPAWLNLGVIFGGDGTASSVSHSDHDHIGQLWSSDTTGAILDLETTSTARIGSGLRTTVRGSNSQAVAIIAQTFSNDAGSAAILAQSGGPSVPAVLAQAFGANAHAVDATASGTGSLAGFFSGNVTVTGILAKSGGSFKIDHPLDPENKYLSHSFVESPDMMNIYNGNIVLDGNGEATVTMPNWFEALNRDFRYQLTPMGKPSPNLYIASEINGNSFRIAGGTPGAKVSWMVTGIRHDAWANAHRIPVEETKPAAEKGKYLTPEVFGQPKEKQVFFAQHAAMVPRATVQPVKTTSGQ